MPVSPNSSSFWSFNISVEPKHSDDDWKRSILPNISILCLIGPPNTGKSSAARLLAECTEYRVLLHKELKRSTSRAKLNKLSSSKDIIENYVKEIKLSYRFCPGYIIVNFPRNINEADLFEKRIRAPNVAISLTLTLDGLLARTVARDKEANLFNYRIAFVESMKALKKIEHRYQQNLIKIEAYYPIEDVINKILDILEDEFCYKFKRLTTKDNYFKTLN